MGIAVEDFCIESPIGNPARDYTIGLNAGFSVFEDDTAVHVEPSDPNFSELEKMAKDFDVVICLQMLDGTDRKSNQVAAHALIGPCLCNAYERDDFEVGDLDDAYFVLAILLPGDIISENVMAALVGLWYPCPANTVKSSYESVHKDYQSQKFGSLLFKALEVAAVYLSKNDRFIMLNLLGETILPIQVCVDLSDPIWHVEMLLKKGYEEIDRVDGARVMEKLLTL